LATLESRHFDTSGLLFFSIGPASPVF